jgi:hypothetical protein
MMLSYKAVLRMVASELWGDESTTPLGAWRYGVGWPPPGVGHQGELHVADSAALLLPLCLGCVRLPLCGL